MKKSLTVLSFALLFVSCGQTADTPGLRSFPKIQVPGLLTDNQEIVDYMALHWWDSFADTSSVFLSDSSHILGISAVEVEEEIANYSLLLSGLPYEQQRKAVFRFCDELEMLEAHNPADSVFERISYLYERYLYDPNSPVRNEESYLPFCEKMLGSAFVSAAKREVYRYQAEMCSLNRPGTRAADFSFSDRNGRVRSLYSVKAENTLLFFSNPGCEACKDIIENLKSIPGIDTAISSGRLAILNIYIDEDVAAWYDYMPAYPDSWINGYDHNQLIRNDVLYNVRAIPSLYALDADKTVLLKDAVEPLALDWVYGICLKDRMSE